MQVKQQWREKRDEYRQNLESKRHWLREKSIQMAATANETIRRMGPFPFGHCVVRGRLARGGPPHAIFRPSDWQARGMLSRRLLFRQGEIRRIRENAWYHVSLINGFGAKRDFLDEVVAAVCKHDIQF